jgi:hypothetical protein
MAATMPKSPLRDVFNILLMTGFFSVITGGCSFLLEDICFRVHKCWSSYYIHQGLAIVAFLLILLALGSPLVSLLRGSILILVKAGELMQWAGNYLLRLLDHLGLSALQRKNGTALVDRHGTVSDEQKSPNMANSASVKQKRKKCTKSTKQKSRRSNKDGGTASDKQQDTTLANTTLAEQYSTPTDELSSTAPNEQNGTNSPFLRLPGELRNKIYRLALVESGKVAVTDNECAEPGLPLVNHQVRKECATIFYYGNKFSVPWPNWDVKTCLKWDRKKRALRQDFPKHKPPSPTRGRFERQDAPNWKNLIQWLEHWHSRRTTWKIDAPSRMKADAKTELLTIGAMFHMVAAIRNEPWNKVSKLLEEHRILLAIDDEG